MSFNYSGDPSTSDDDYVRFRLGDTDKSNVLLTDEEISGCISIAGSREAGAYFAAKALLSKWSREVDSRMGKLDLKLSQRVTSLKSLLSELEEEAKQSGGLGTPWMAAHSIGRRNAIVDDSDRLDPAFSVAMHDVERQSADGEFTDELIQ